jgi:hypothetical protein
MANSFPGSGLAYADQFSVGTSGTQAASLYVCSSCVRSAVIENNYAQTNLHHNTLWLRQNNSSGCNYASIGFTIINNGGDHHRVNIAATANDATAGGNLALYTRNNNGNDTLGLYINHAGNIGMGTCVPNTNLHIYTTGQPNVSCGLYATQILQTDSQANYQRIRFDRDSCAFWGIGVEGANSSNDLIISGLIGGKTSGNWSDNVFRIKNSTGYVGIGITTPRFSLDVAGGAMSNFYMSCCNATVDGIGPYDYGIIGSGNGAGAILINDIVGARYSVAAGSYNLTFRKSVRNTVGACVYCTIMTFVGTADTNCVPNVSITNSLGIGTSSPSDKLHILGADNGITICASASNRPVLSLYSAANLMLKLSANSTFGAIADNSGSDVMYFKGGCVSIGTSTPSYKLHVNGTFYAAGSSQDYKQSICNYNTDSCMFMKLKPVTYQYKDEYTHLGKELKSGTQIGLIAEEVAETYPELAILVNEDDQKIVRNVDYEKLSIVLLSEVQKLRKELDELKTK